MTTKKAMLLTTVILLGIIVLIAGVKALQIGSIVSTFSNMPEPKETVGVYVAERQSWPNTYTAMGTVEASEGITITAEVAGKVEQLLFKSGDFVKKGTVILTQESGNERAQLSAAEARLKLASANYDRLKQLRVSNTVSQSELDAALQQRESAQGDVNDLKTTLNKKQIRAPFDGKLGIREVDPGQDLQVGTAIVSLQATHHVRVNFSVPQFWLVQMSRGLNVDVNVGDGSENVVSGQITAIGAEINPTTRSAKVQAFLDNASGQLMPGMAVETTVTLTAPRDVLAIPSTAITFAPFGDTTFVIEEKAGELSARQQFIRIGASRGDFVEVVDGLEEGDRVVSAGAFRLKNGQAVMISSEPQVEFNQEPVPADN